MALGRKIDSFADNVVSLFPRRAATRGWSDSERAEFYRVNDMLVRVGIAVETDEGITDEGEPWFVFCHADTGDVIVHFARVTGCFIAFSSSMQEPISSRSFAELVQRMSERLPLVMPTPKPGQGLFIHPAALLVATVATLFFKSSGVEGDESDPSRDNTLRTNLNAQLSSTATASSADGYTIAMASALATIIAFRQEQDNDTALWSDVAAVLSSDTQVSAGNKKAASLARENGERIAQDEAEALALAEAVKEAWADTTPTKPSGEADVADPEVTSRADAKEASPSPQKTAETVGHPAETVHAEIPSVQARNEDEAAHQEPLVASANGDGAERQLERKLGAQAESAQQEGQKSFAEAASDSAKSSTNTFFDIGSLTPISKALTFADQDLDDEDASFEALDDMAKVDPIATIDPLERDAFAFLSSDADVVDLRTLFEAPEMESRGRADVEVQLTGFLSVRVPTPEMKKATYAFTADEILAFFEGAGDLRMAWHEDDLVLIDPRLLEGDAALYARSDMDVITFTDGTEITLIGLNPTIMVEATESMTAVA